MSIDDLRTINDDSPIETDLCLIGSGPAGWAIAEELKDSGLRILMLESGGRDVDPDAAALNEVEDVGVRLFNGRARVLGGTSRLWNGRCVPFDDIDYEERPWVPHSGWPFNARAMAPYVDRASEHLGAGPYYAGTERRPLPQGPQPRPGVNPALMRSIWWENPGYIDFGQVLTTRRSANLWVLVRATVTHLNTDPYGRHVESVEVADANGRRLTVRARAFVLCAGGVENPRILLYSNRVNPEGVGNAHDLVGRYLMDHPRDLRLAARVEERDVDRFRDLFGPYDLDNPRGRHEFWHGFVLSPERVRAERLLNTAAWPYEEIAADDPFDAVKRLLRGPRDRALRDARLAASQPGLLMRGLRSRLVDKQKVRRKAERTGFLVSSEQVPDRDSRVELADRKDWLGLPITRTNWRVGELETRSQAVLAQTIAAEFARLGLPPIRLADWVRSGRVEDAQFVDGCHPIGTTRMADEPRQGVVDADCQVHGVDGLYVAGSSVFPTAGHANPTLMIVALAVRLAEHLKERLAAKASPRVAGRPQPVLAAD
jgi:choline dehydrogenase-like flavoprotein